MKRVYALGLTLILVLGLLSGCGRGTTPAEEPAPTEPATTEAAASPEESSPSPGAASPQGSLRVGLP